MTMTLSAPGDGEFRPATVMRPVAFPSACRVSRDGVVHGAFPLPLAPLVMVTHEAWLTRSTRTRWPLHRDVPVPALALKLLLVGEIGTCRRWRCGDRSC